MSHPKTIFHLLQQQVPVVFKFTFSKNGLPWIRIFHLWVNMRQPGVAELLRQFVTKWEDVMKAWYTWLSLILLEPAHVTSKNQKPQEMAVLRFLWLFLTGSTTLFIVLGSYRQLCHAWLKYSSFEPDDWKPIGEDKIISCHPDGKLFRYPIIASANWLLYKGNITEALVKELRSMTIIILAAINSLSWSWPPWSCWPVPPTIITTLITK